MAPPCRRLTHSHSPRQRPAPHVAPTSPQALRNRFHYHGPPEVLDEIFASLDTDGSGTIGFDELFEFLNGRKHSLDPRHRKALDLRLLPPGALATRPDDILWSSSVIRLLLNRMLRRSQAGPAQLMRAWNGRQGLRQDQFVEKMRDSFFARAGKTSSAHAGTHASSTPSAHTGAHGAAAAADDGVESSNSAAAQDAAELWEAEVKPAVLDAFNEMMRLVRGQNFLNRVGIVQLERWLSDSGSGGSGGGTGGSGGGTAGSGGGGNNGGSGGMEGNGGEDEATDGPPVPLKSARQRRVQQDRRAARDRTAAEQAAKLARQRSEKVDWTAYAHVGILRAVATKQARERASRKAEAALRAQLRRGALSPTESRLLPTSSRLLTSDSKLVVPPRGSSPRLLGSPRDSPSKASPPGDPSLDAASPLASPPTPQPPTSPRTPSTRGMSRDSPHASPSRVLGTGSPLASERATPSRGSQTARASVTRGSSRARQGVGVPAAMTGASARAASRAASRRPTTVAERCRDAAPPSPQDEEAFYHYQVRAFEHTQRVREEMERHLESMRKARTLELCNAAETAHQALEKYHAGMSGTLPPIASR